MADKRCFVQFPHPGGEHEPDHSGKVGWHKFRDPHKRKFMQVCGEWIDEDDNRHSGNLRAWGEWEPESQVIPAFKSQKRDPHDPCYLWEPYWVPKNSYRGLHNTDPFIFGDCFLYSNCGQSAPNKKGLKHLDRGSVIAFGSGKKVNGDWKWVLDTVLVVKKSFPYDPLNPCKGLAGKVPDEFLEVTGGPLTNDPKLKKSADNGKAQEFRLYQGAIPDDPVDGMFSFFPAIPDDGDSCFPRPDVTLDNDFFTASNTQAPKGAGRNLSPDTIRSLWCSLVTQVRKAGLVLGTRAEMPERRAR